MIIAMTVSSTPSGNSTCSTIIKIPHTDGLRRCWDAGVLGCCGTVSVKGSIVRDGRGGI